MCDNLDAFLEDILALPRWVNRGLSLLRELDLKSQECGEEAQRRRRRYLDLARTKLQAANASHIPDNFYDDPELQAEAAAASDRGREAHALMREKVVVLNQLIRVLRGETESFKVSLARFAKEVGGEEMLRHSRRKTESGVGGHADRPDGDQAAPDAVSSLPPGVTSSAAVASRSRPSKKSAVRSNGSVASSAAEGTRPLKRPKAPAVDPPAKTNQGKEGGTVYAGGAENFMMQVRLGTAEGVGGHQSVQAGASSSGTSLGSQQLPTGGRIKRSKQPAETLQDISLIVGQAAHLPPSDVQEDQSMSGRAAKAGTSRLKKNREPMAEVAFAATSEAATAPTDARQCEPAVGPNECIAGPQPAGLVIRLPPTMPLSQQLPATKAKSPAERFSMKPTPRSLAVRTNNMRTPPG
ncbi:hypothetical protein Efla_002006 [Eimeria flavescens]